jgi:hypothetical protein
MTTENNDDSHQAVHLSDGGGQATCKLVIVRLEVSATGSKALSPAGTETKTFLSRHSTHCRLVMLPMLSGSVPVNWFALRSKTLGNTE